MTLQKIALEAGVSVSTVSKAFSNARDISEKTRNTIFEIARKHGCYGKYAKTTYSKKVIGIICSEINSEYYSACVEKLKTVIESAGGIMIVSQDDFDPDKRLELVDYYSSYLHVDGIIVFGRLSVDESDISVPVVSVGKNIGIDLRSSIRDALEYLVVNNHKNIAFVSEEKTSSKMNLFVDVMNKMRLPLMKENLIVSQSRFEDAGKYGADILVNTPCTAVICAYDYIALGLIERLEELGFKVPDDYSVIGMDNIRASQYTLHSLTTISYPVEELCEKSVDLIFKKIENKYYVCENIHLKSNFVIRGTTSSI